MTVRLEKPDKKTKNRASPSASARISWSFPRKKRNKPCSSSPSPAGSPAANPSSAVCCSGQGCYVHSADTAARELMAPGTSVWRDRRRPFRPRNPRDPDRTIDRAKLGAIIFADDEERAFLNGLIHPLVLEKTGRPVARLEKEGRHKIFVSEAALIVEAGFARVLRQDRRRPLRQRTSRSGG